VQGQTYIQTYIRMWLPEPAERQSIVIADSTASRSTLADSNEAARAADAHAYS
jgi:hypothetical protein